jgi:3-hydroxy-9,10-secoandrosta-1,3,5(10)-triene-9,17-dione monooxygenase reductase component
LGYLLGRSHYQFVGGIRATLNERGLNEVDFFVLSLLSVQEPLSASAIAGHVAYTAIDVGPVLLQALCDRGLLEQPQADSFMLSAIGRDAILHVLAAAKAEEADVTDQLGEMEAAMLRNLLKRLIRITDPGLPKLWTARSTSTTTPA